MNTIGYNYMVNHTMYEHHYTVVIITWLIILGMNAIIMVFVPSMINHVIITTV
jgi:hypothetical protein